MFGCSGCVSRAGLRNCGAAFTGGELPWTWSPDSGLTEPLRVGVFATPVQRVCEDGPRALGPWQSALSRTARHGTHGDPGLPRRQCRGKSTSSPSTTSAQITCVPPAGQVLGKNSRHRQWDSPCLLLSWRQQADGLKEQEGQPGLEYAEEFECLFSVQTRSRVSRCGGLIALRLKNKQFLHPSLPATTVHSEVTDPASLTQ